MDLTASVSTEVLCRHHPVVGTWRYLLGSQCEAQCIELWVMMVNTVPLVQVLREKLPCLRLLPENVTVAHHEDTKGSHRTSWWFIGLINSVEEFSRF